MKILSILLPIVISLRTCSVLAQTNSSLTSQYEAEIYRDTKWGGITNGIQFGIRICAIGPSAKDNFKVFSALFNTNSSNIFGLWRLPTGYRFDEISLTSRDGKVIHRTATGNRLCKPPPSNLSNGRVVVLDPRSPFNFDELFDVRDCFEIKEAGTYTLTVKARLYSIEKFHVFKKLDLPEARVDFEIKEPNLTR